MGGNPGPSARKAGAILLHHARRLMAMLVRVGCKKYRNRSNQPACPTARGRALLISVAANAWRATLTPWALQLGGGRKWPRVPAPRNGARVHTYNATQNGRTTKTDALDPQGPPEWTRKAPKRKPNSKAMAAQVFARGPVAWRLRPVAPLQTGKLERGRVPICLGSLARELLEDIKF